MAPSWLDALRERLDDLDEGVLVWGADGRLSEWNAGAERLFGALRAEALGADVSRFLPALPPCSARKPQEQRLLSEGAAVDGRRMPLSLVLTPLAGAHGGALAIVRRAAGAGGTPPTESDAERLSLALAAARLGDWSWDARTDLVTLSDRTAEIFGVPPGTRLTWTAMRRALHPDDRESARLAVERALLSRGNYSIEYRVIDGPRERWVAASGRGRYGPHGEILGMFGVVQDITNDRLLVRLDDLVRPLSSPAQITSTVTRLIGQHLDVHRCAYVLVEEDEDTFSVSGDYANGAPSLAGRHQLRQLGEECLRLMRAGLPYVVENSAEDPRIQQSERPAYEQTAVRAAVCVPILAAGRLAAGLEVHMQRPRLWSASEVELVQRAASRCWESLERARVEREREDLLERAEAANRAKDEFLAMLGHELRNPLAPIVTALQLMKLSGESRFVRERTVIERQVLHLTRLVDDLLDVSRIAQAKVVLKLERIELWQIVKDAIEVASPLLEEQAHSLEVDVPEHGLLVEVDAARLTQVLSNLLNNASKYTPRHGRVTVSAAVEGGQVTLRVRDNGMGISGDALPRVFDLFIQGRQAIDRAEGGLGLGLTIARSLVERHGGSIAAHSDGPGRGAEFVLRLPCAAPAVAGASQPPSSARPSQRPPRRGVRVLVVDDNEDAAEMLADALAMRGHEPVVAHDGPAALQLAARESFDVALLDIGLPVLDGYELAARLRELPHLSHTRLIAVTGYGQASDRERGRAAGFHHHLVKPVHLETLHALVSGVEDVPGG